jgi:hypothetical protein
LDNATLLDAAAILRRWTIEPRARCRRPTWWGRRTTRWPPRPLALGRHADVAGRLRRDRLGRPSRVVEPCRGAAVWLVSPRGGGPVPDRARGARAVPEGARRRAAAPRSGWPSTPWGPIPFRSRPSAGTAPRPGRRDSDDEYSPLTSVRLIACPSRPSARRPAPAAARPTRRWCVPVGGRRRAWNERLVQLGRQPRQHLPVLLPPTR